MDKSKLDRSWFNKYKYSKMAFQEVDGIIKSFPDLRPEKDDFIFSGGQKKDLVKLKGTIPVIYRGSTYNIPIQLFLMDSHPYNPPAVYVIPTATMTIKQTRIVDAQGRVNMPYISEWKHPQSDLYGLIAIMSIEFGDNCPVFSNQAGGGGGARSQVAMRPPPQPAVQPPHHAGPGGPGSAVSSSTPYPGAGGGGYMPMPSLSNPYGSGGPQQRQPYPPPPQAAYGGPTGAMPPQQPGAMPPAYGATPPYPQPPVYPGYPGAAPQTGYPMQHQQPPQRPPPPGVGTAAAGGYGQSSQQQMHIGAAVGSGAAGSGGSGGGGYGSLTEDEIRMSMVSAVEDKLKRKLLELFSQAEAEMKVLRKTHDDLTSGRAKLNQMKGRLEQECAEVENNLQILVARETELKEAVSQLENTSEVDVDEAVVPTTPLYSQLFNAFAEEQAIEDAIYYLGEALKKEVIDLETYLKQVRNLSRRQYMQKALIYKCREKAGLAPLN